ncbi:MAG TPA: hypothetical protein VIQ02_05375 [Jiangellaceae bacterium]|jgi:hypothetical protein
MPEKTPTPLYAAAGAADAVAAALRELSARAPEIAQRAETFSTQVRDRLSGLPGDMQKLRADLPADVQKLRAELPSDVQRLRSELPADFQKLRAQLPTLVQDISARVLQYAAGLASGLTDRYAELANRGEVAVARFRRDGADAVNTATDKVADTAEKAADVADKVADEIADAPVAQRKRRPSSR